MFLHASVLCAGLLAGASAATGSEAQSPAADETQELRARIAALETEVRSLRAQTGEAWLDAKCAEEIRGLVHEVLADADTRATLLQSGATGGWDHGFFLGSSDGNYLLRVNGQLQVRAIYNHQDNSPTDDTRYGFENTRTKLIFTGHVVNPSWIFRVEGNFSRDGGSFGLQDAYIGHAFDNGWTLLAGQLKAPVLREELVLDPYQLAVERSLVNQEFTAGRTQGVAIDWRGDNLHFTGGFTDGHANTGGFNMPALAADTEYALTARGEVLLAGAWDQFTDLTSFPGEPFAALLGAAAHYQVGEYGTAAGEVEVFQWTVDGSLEFGGANVFAYIVGRHIDAGATELDQYGFVIQGGFFLTDSWELFARYEWGDDDLSDEDLSVITVGVNRYFSKHQLKWTTDVGYGLNEVTGTWADGFIGMGGDIAGWRTDGAGEDGQFVLRSQFQLLF